MFTLEWQSFVLQRRVNRPPASVLRVIANSAVFGPGCVIAGGRDGVLCLDEPFRRIDFHCDPAWRARGELVGARRRRVAAVEIEISSWSEDATQLLIRPRARNPQRWSAQRLRHYFALAHRSADELTHMLTDTTPHGEQLPARPWRHVGLPGAPR